MPGFTGVAEWGVQQLLVAKREDAARIANQCFPGMPESVALRLYDGELQYSFTNEGNTIRVEE